MAYSGLSLHWSCEGSLNGPSAVNAVPDRRVANPCFPRPLRHRLRNAVQAQIAIVRLVVILLFDSGPAAIAGLVSLTVINPINRVFGRTLPHIGKEILVRTRPSLAEYVRDVFVPGRFLAPEEIVPHHVGPRLFPKARVPMFIALATPTRSGAARNEGLARCDFYIPASAAALPQAPPPSIGTCGAYYREPAELLPNQLSWRCHCDRQCTAERGAQ